MNIESDASESFSYGEFKKMIQYMHQMKFLKSVLYLKMIIQQKFKFKIRYKTFFLFYV